MRNELLGSLIDELARFGVTQWMVDQRGKHPKLRFSFAGRDISIVYPCSSSDHRARDNAVSQLRRVVGIRKIPTKCPAAAARRTKHRLHAKVTSPPPVHFTVKPDPFSVLARFLLANAAHDGADQSTRQAMGNGEAA